PKFPAFLSHPFAAAYRRTAPESTPPTSPIDLAHHLFSSTSPLILHVLHRVHPQVHHEQPSATPARWRTRCRGSCRDTAAGIDSGWIIRSGGRRGGGGGGGGGGFIRRFMVLTIGTLSLVVSSIADPLQHPQS
ncbi:hypothetical protein LINPERHAP2_LOCUS6414, partial [Linum perenne]